MGIFNDGMAIVINDSRLCGFIDKQGNEVIPCKYIGASGFSEGLAAVEDSTTLKWGFIDKQGNEVIPCKYMFNDKNINDFLCMIESNGKRSVYRLSTRKLLFRY